MKKYISSGREGAPWMAPLPCAYYDQQITGHSWADCHIVTLHFVNKWWLHHHHHSLLTVSQDTRDNSLTSPTHNNWRNNRRICHRSIGRRKGQTDFPIGWSPSGSQSQDVKLGRRREHPQSKKKGACFQVHTFYTI